MNALRMFCLLWSWLLFQATYAGAHNVDELKAIFDPTPIPEELKAATKELNATAGMKSIREEAHDKQHALLDQYVRALTERKCREAIASISEVDREIVEARDQGTIEVEQQLRQLRDDTAAFVAAKCTETSIEKFPKPLP